MEILLTLFGAIFGFVLGAAYERFMEHKKQKQIRNLLARELNGNLTRLREVLETIRYLSDGFPPGAQPLTIEEIASRTDNACLREAFESVFASLPVLGSKALEKIFDFYDSCRNIPNSFREVERFAGDIRAGLFEDNIRHLIEKGEAAKDEIAA